MNINRRQWLLSGSAFLSIGALLRGSRQAAAQATPPRSSAASGSTRVPVITPNGSTLPWTMDGDVKVFHLTAEPVRREFAPGMTVNCWGYNGLTPGPTIEAVEGDHVRILVTNRLPEPTSIHWHGIFLPNGMDGVGGLTQPHIPPGETYAYEFPLRQHGTFMYHPHSDELLQLALGMMGFLIIHPKTPEPPAVDRDFCIMLHEWFIEPGSATPNPFVMTDFNTFTFNSRVFPAIDHLIVRRGDRVRLRFANLSMDSHPIHIHGHRFWITGSDGGRIPPSAWVPETTVNVPVGATRDVEFDADLPGDWALHCHKSHHTMGPMGHDLPVMVGVSQSGIETRVRRLLPDYMAMGESGMAEHARHAQRLPLPHNTLPMMTGEGPFGPIEMGGMFTVIKIRDNLSSYDQDPGWYDHPPGTVPWPVAS